VRELSILIHSMLNHASQYTVTSQCDCNFSNHFQCHTTIWFKNLWNTSKKIIKHQKHEFCLNKTQCNVVFQLSCLVRTSKLLTTDTHLLHLSFQILSWHHCLQTLVFLLAQLLLVLEVTQQVHKVAGNQPTVYLLSPNLCLQLTDCLNQYVKGLCALYSFVQHCDSMHQQLHFVFFQVYPPIHNRIYDFSFWGLAV